MRILIVYSCLPLGGIETFLLRLIKQLKNKGFQVSVLFFSHKFDEKLYLELSSYAKIQHWDDFVYMPKFLKNTFPVFKLLFPLKVSKIKKDLLSDITHIHAPDINSLLFSSRLLNYNKNISCSTGVYHINEFNVNPFKTTYFGKQLIQFVSILPFQNILFFNEISKKVYNADFQNKFQDSLVAPIGIDLQKYEGSLAGIQNKRITSIGRLASWKTYNFYMIEVIEKLNKKNIFLTYESFGDGEQRTELEKLVKIKNLEKQIFFHNAISYDLFKQKIENSLLFIGSGTALIEASACGIPALIGVENLNEASTYGFLHNTTSYSYQEKQLDYPKNEIEYFIQKLLNQSPNEYKKECEKARDRATDFSIETSTTIFLDMIKNSKCWRIEMSWFKTLSFVISLIIHLLCTKIKKTYHLSFFNRL